MYNDPALEKRCENYRKKLKTAENKIKKQQAEIERLKNDLLDALDVKNGNGPTALSMMVSENQTLKQRIKELEEDMDKTIELLKKADDQADRYKTMVDKLLNKEENL
jgi:chromosome segregation ATPase